MSDDDVWRWDMELYQSRVKLVSGLTRRARLRPWIAPTGTGSVAPRSRMGTRSSVRDHGSMKRPLLIVDGDNLAHRAYPWGGKILSAL